VWPGLTIWWRRLAGGIKRGPDGRPDRAALIARAPLAMSIALAFAIAAQAISITAALVHETGVMSVAGSGVGGLRRRAQGFTSAAALNSVAAAHLFGAAEVPMSAAAAAASRAPLVLTGIIATQDPKDGYAIIGSSAAATRLFHAGSPAAPGVILAEVYPQEVVLLKGDQRLTLRLPKAALAGGIGDSYGGMRTRVSPPEVAATDDDDASPQPSPGDFKPPPASDGNTIIGAFSLRRVSIDGQSGARIMDTGLNSKTLAALGLAPGDVITQINGSPIGSKDAPNLEEAIKQGSATLTIDRNGESTSVTIDPTAAATAAEDYRDPTPDQ
jgi:type II secretory pathway component PulC